MQPGCNETRSSGNETPPRCQGATCAMCGVPLQRSVTGRPRRFCSPAHRVRYHRLHRPSAPVHPEGPQPSLESNRPTRIDALQELNDRLDDLRPPTGAGRLRHLAEMAENLSDGLEDIGRYLWALEPDDMHLADLVGTFLSDHHHTLRRLVDLHDLAHDLEALVRDLRHALRRKSDVELMLLDLEEVDEST